MGDESLRIPIDIDYSKGISDIKQFSDAAKKTIGNIAPGTGSKDGTISIPINVDPSKAIKGFRDMVPGANQASQALINVGRVAQDLPYGFIGIANNLNPLLESFQRLRAESGSTGGALRALVGSLSGAGGIGLALSAVTAIMQFATIGLTAWTRGLFGSAKAAEENSQALEALNTKLENAKKRVDSLGDSISFLNHLASINIKINGLPEVLGKQGQSVGIMEELSKARDEILKAQTNLQDARALDNEDSNAKTKKALEDATNNLAAAFAKEKDLMQQQSIIRREIALQKVEDQKDADKKADEAYKKYLEQLRKRMKEEEELRKELRKIVREYTQARDENIPRHVSDYTEKPLDTFQQPEFSLSFLGNVDLVRAFQQKFQGVKIKLPELDMEAPPGFNKHIIDAYTKNIDAKAIQDAIKNINNIIKETAIAGFTNFGEAIGTALASGDIRNIFKNFANVIADGFSAIGKQMIAASPVIAALKAALKSLNPAVLLPAGLALVAIGAALRTSIGNGVKGFAEGGLAAGPLLALVGEGRGTSRNNPEVVSPLDSLKGFFAGMLNDFSARASIAGGNVGANGLALAVKTDPLRFDGRDFVAGMSIINQMQQRGG